MIIAYIVLIIASLLFIFGAVTVIILARKFNDERNKAIKEGTLNRGASMMFPLYVCAVTFVVVTLALIALK